MQHIANDHHPPADEAGGRRLAGFEMAGQGEQIKQALAWVAVQSVAGIEHRHLVSPPFQIPGQAMRDAGTAMAHHQHIAAHRHIGAGRIQQAFALAQRTGGGREGLNIGRKTPGRQFKTAAGAGAGFKEQGGHQPSLQRRQLAGPGHRQLAEALGQLQHGGVIRHRKRRQVEYMAVGPAAQRTIPANSLNLRVDRPGAQAIPLGLPSPDAQAARLLPLPAGGPPGPGD